jgi:hypothetical protein
MQRIAKGLIAGAAGTEALNVTTYLDMLVRGRGPSSVPEAMVDKVVSLDDNRKSALATLLGYATGLGIGAVHGLLGGRLPAPVVGLAAMAATDSAIAASGVSDPREWSTTDWLSDLVPHLVFGWGVARTYDALR